ncbi:protein-L-isoaspartate O-methyltransferase [Mucor circinelloides 1006PhL]|uniref:Protein-L-isoaspartate O-methyltransferase n=1 Tax=Mucor circinelloides f. circinelloides (strain 1006PhL) TaxID=1220926 RepID=S2JU69_MUCC1|nr:protein-L-isoaspartate O-methyltransferase [Mucor circinelloides 1006PhL]
MAWACSATSNERLVQKLLQASIITKERVVQAMKTVDRRDFCPRDPYEDSPQGIGYGVTISAPHMHGYALDKLEPFLEPGMRALDIGSGSGYLTACMASMVGSSGKAVGVEHIRELVDSAKRNLQKNHLDYHQLEFVAGDGRLGYEKEAPYDCIHVGAAAPVTPQSLISQLKSPGRLFIPVGKEDEEQWIMIYDKDEHGHITETKWLGVKYVPLTDVENQKKIYG